MASENAKAVAKEVSENLRKGKRVILGKIIAKRYSKSVSEKPKIVTETKRYKEVMKPIVDQLEEERQRAITKLKGKISKAKYHHLIDGIDKLTKNIQLLGGKPTENIGIFNKKQIDEIAKRISARSGGNGGVPSKEQSD